MRKRLITIRRFYKHLFKSVFFIGISSQETIPYKNDITPQKVIFRIKKLEFPTFFVLFILFVNGKEFKNPTPGFAITSNWKNVESEVSGIEHKMNDYALFQEFELNSMNNSNDSVKTNARLTHAERLGFSEGKKVLLLHMDDLGMCKEANDAGKFYIEKDYILSGAVMMPCEYAVSFVEWAKLQSKADIGVHLTLNSEWETWRWGPLTDVEKVPGLLDPNGKMWRSMPEVVMNATPQEVEIEVRAQIEKMLALGYKPTHIDTHMGTLCASPEFLKVFLKVAEEYKIPANAIDFSNPEIADYYRERGFPIDKEIVQMLQDYNLPLLDNYVSVPNGKSYEEIKANFFKLVSALKPGLTEIIFHPSVETENLKTITKSWQQRVWEAKMFSDHEVQTYFEDTDIILITWREVMERFEKMDF